MMVTVERAPGPDGESVPQRLHLGSRPVDVVETLDRWPGADHLYVKLHGADGALYILRHDAARDIWELTLYEAADGGRVRPSRARRAENAGERCSILRAARS